MKNTFFILIIAALCCKISLAQIGERTIVQKKDTLVTIPFCAVSLGYTMPYGEMGNRYRSFMDLGVDIGWKNKNNWLFNFNVGFQFGSNNVKILNQVLSGMMTTDDEPFVVSVGGVDAAVIAWNRNLSGKFSVGKVVPLWFSNQNSGLMLMLGAGYLQHQIMYQATNDIAPQLEGDYALLYDRQMRGPMLSSFIGYLFFGKYTFANFYAGIQYDIAFTKLTRKYQADLRGGDPNWYSDRMLTLKAAWIFQFHNPTSERIYY
ncbi:MAG: hypothetical protein LBR28_04435 [Bacteroidales bacterium]|jgi:hypothetical protein|nr:hypothetical protein [Bacteroidales bacterium]